MSGKCQIPKGECVPEHLKVLPVDLEESPYVLLPQLGEVELGQLVAGQLVWLVLEGKDIHNLFFFLKKTFCCAQ